jgi:hypothetical protein
MKITNNSQQPQGIHGVNGLVWVQPGQTVNAELTEAQAGRASAIEGVSVEGKPGPVKSGGERNSEGDTAGEAQLRAQFDASWEQARKRAGAQEGESLGDAIDRLLASDASKFEGELRAALEIEKSVGILDAITDMKDRIAGLELELEEAKKLIPVPPAYEAKHRGAGSWSVMQGDTEVVEKLDKTAAEAFNALSDEDKAKFVEANKQKDG